MPPVQPAPHVVSAPAPAKGTSYVVKITDSYPKIAKAHHITVAKLKAANNIKSDTLHAGQKLIIPGTEKTQMAATAPTPTPAPVMDAPTGPILTESPAPGPTAMHASVNTVSSTPVDLAAPAPASAMTHGHIYTVVKGDTLVKIAHKFKTTPGALMAANNITDPAKLSIGKKLKIPAKETRSAKNTAPTAEPAQVQAKSTAPAPAPTGQLANFMP